MSDTEARARGAGVATPGVDATVRGSRPVCVLGAVTAQLLDIDRIFPGERIWISQATGMWFYVAGILRPAVYASQLDPSVLVGFQAAEKYLGFDSHPSTVYVRAADDRVDAVDSLLGAQANPENPSEVNVSLPSAALVAQRDSAEAFNALFLGIGAIALLVGAIGVANIMVIACSNAAARSGCAARWGRPGATSGSSSCPRPSRWPSPAGPPGCLPGRSRPPSTPAPRGGPWSSPAQAWAGGIGAAVLIGAGAGLLPALRAARMSPTQALWSV